MLGLAANMALLVCFFIYSAVGVLCVEQGLAKVVVSNVFHFCLTQGSRPLLNLT